MLCYELSIDPLGRAWHHSFVRLEPCKPSVDLFIFKDKMGLVGISRYLLSRDTISPKYTALVGDHRSCSCSFLFHI